MRQSGLFVWWVLLTNARNNVSHEFNSFISSNTCLHLVIYKFTLMANRMADSLPWVSCNGLMHECEDLLSVTARRWLVNTPSQPESPREFPYSTLVAFCHCLFYLTQVAMMVLPSCWFEDWWERAVTHICTIVSLNMVCSSREFLQSSFTLLGQAGIYVASNQTFILSKTFILWMLIDSDK